MTSAAHGTTVGNTVLDVTLNGAGGGGQRILLQGGCCAAPVALYGDKIDSTWTLMTDGDTKGVKLTTGEFVTVVEAEKGDRLYSPLAMPR